jgi:stage V sporulation protein G
MEITEVTIRLANEGYLRAHASITLDDCFVIRNLRIIEGPNGLFVAIPKANRKRVAPLDIARPIREELRKSFEDRILTEYRKVAGDDGDDVA